MIHGKTRRFEEDARETNFWVSYSDLMAGMLLVFVLLLVVALFHFAELTRQKQRRLRSQEDKMKSFYALQQRLIGDLRERFDAETASIDPDTGVLQIDSGILFGEGETALSAAGQARLTAIFEAYINVVLDDEYRAFIKQIEIEGHTNSNGTYLFNLELSQQRALTVMRQLLAQAGQRRQALQQMTVAGGRSFSHLIRDAQGREDPIRSRRIEIKFRLKEAELFRDIYRELATRP